MMTDEVTTTTEPDPGWSNTTDTVGDPPPPDVELFASPMDTPGWSNNPAGAGSPVDSTGLRPLPGWSNTGPAATGATAGTPGTFTPAGAALPLNLGALTGVTASPATAWTTGQYVVLRDGSYAYWSSTAWTAGKKP